MPRCLSSRDHGAAQAQRACGVGSLRRGGQQLPAAGIIVAFQLAGALQLIGRGLDHDGIGGLLRHGNPPDRYWPGFNVSPHIQKVASELSKASCTPQG